MSEVKLHPFDRAIAEMLVRAGELLSRQLEERFEELEQLEKRVAELEARVEKLEKELEKVKRVEKHEGKEGKVKAETVKCGNERNVREIFQTFC